MIIANYSKIRGIIHTEKTNSYLENGKYCIMVDRLCAKEEIKYLFESLFNVKIIKIAVINVLGKAKRFRGVVGKRKSYKKAWITIEKGKVINFQDLKVKNDN